MKAVILAAGRGTRLRPLTDECPKCMVRLGDKPLVVYQIEAMRDCGIEDISIVTGYRSELVTLEGVKKFVNRDYETTNMVATLMSAGEYLDDELIVSYGDIVYEKSVLSKLIESKSDVSVVVDLDWREYWQARMEDPLQDAETLKMDSEGHIVELGKKPSSYSEIEAQYIGLMKFSSAVLPEIISLYDSLDPELLYDGKSKREMYMTTFLEEISRNIAPLKAVPIHNGWMEVDTPSDLEFFEFVEKGRS
jgi:choline kinase